MGKAVKDLTFDAALAKAATGSRIVVCSGEPANFAGIAAVTLADDALTPGDGNGDFVIADGSVSGRKVTVSQQANATIDASGTATHVSIDDGANLLLVTTCTSQVLTSGGTVTIPTFAWEITDPT